ncbi:putative unusual protein kinase regulating ubiquinone biosynthesis (AarF/ABC1/UbiB family) [Cryobacterium mesophilum]|uniref:AarF/ABC1/UbiB kinase family protein n=1 Tax=Terrimesophilobacter mesophilus TaxID=433647 RepID=A0A4R8V887_9MICO|nr:AarF/UbiB family protein [Terrimesophilobacter mesophilus]MBB5631986.1 putative unusual protein kinase regulating ubiquinone biosynthesis (AarF/ABC1/UbiB family) [Terrimesophilobacter mesophilus]TFB78883.1 AarF/ABC1/UbiB kinase family protein [Terrimesophilobacter mesophilus]
MTEVRHLRARYRRILRFATRYILQEWWFEVLLPRIGLARIAKRSRAKRARGIARHFHHVAVDLGGLMIKVGQFMSSRLDVLPPEITSELEGLQDEVPPADFAQVRELAEADLGVPLSRAYSFFDPEPVAAASLGQVHRARLSPADAELVGFEDVVVKIQRPGIGEVVKVDLAALRKIAARLNRVTAISQRMDLPALLEEFATVSLEEIDYLHEGTNAERFADNFRDNPRVDTPIVVWERTTRRVLTLSDVSAIKINDRSALIAAGINPTAVADGLSSAMFDQLFTHGFFHADPHPGNIFVKPSSGDTRDWTLAFVDFGMMGEVPDALRGGLERLVIAVAARDVKGLVASIRAMGMLLPTAESAPLEQAMGELFARFGGLGFAELRSIEPHEYKDFAEKFGRAMREMPFQLPENLLLIIRAVAVTSGVCTALNPSFNIWTAIEPYAARLASGRTGATARAILGQVVTTAGVLGRLPAQLDELSTLIQRGRLSIQIPGVDRRLRALERLGRKATSAVIFAGLLLGGIFLRPDDMILGWVLIGASAIPLLHAVFAGTTGRDR